MSTSGIGIACSAAAVSSSPSGNAAISGESDLLTRGEGTPDIFVHMEVLRLYGLSDLMPGEAVCVRCKKGPRGKTATEIRSWDHANLVMRTAQPT